MQINNNPSAQNFGMALKIKPEALPVLRTKSSDFLNRVAKAGEELKNTKYWDVEIGAGKNNKDLEYVVNGRHCANAYICDIRPKEEPRDKFLTLKAVWAGTEGICGRHVGDECQTVMQMANKDAALKGYAKLKEHKYYDGLENATNATKVLEEWSEAQEARRIAEVEEDRIKNDLVYDLFSKFGVE